MDLSPEGGLISWMRRVYSGFSVGFAHVTHRMRSPETHAFNSRRPLDQELQDQAQLTSSTLNACWFPLCSQSQYNLVVREPALQIKNTDRNACTVFPIGNDALLI